MPEPRRSLLLPPAAGRQPTPESSLTPPLQPLRRSQPPRGGSSTGKAERRGVRPAARDEGAVGGEMVPSAGLVVRMLQEEITKRDKWLVQKDEQMQQLLQTKDEQMQQLLRTKDEQMREKDEQIRHKDEQMRDLLRTKDEQLREKDEQMRELVRAKDEQVSGLVASMSPASQISSASHRFPASPMPYASPQPPSSPAAAVAAAERRHTRRSHLRAEEAQSRQQVPAAAGRDHSADVAAREGAATPAMSALTVALSELQGSGAQAALTAVLEHGLEALESIPRVPRKEKKAVRRLCEQVESTLEELGTDQATQLVEQCEAAELAELHRALGAVSGMGIGLVGMESMEAVESLLGIWKQCSDPMIRASRALGSVEAGARARALETLRGLPRVVLVEAVEAEVALVPAAGAIGVDEERSDRERVSAFLAVFTLGLRNTAMAVEAVGELVSDSVSAVIGAAFSGRLHGREGLAVAAAQSLLSLLLVSFVLQLESAAKRAASAKLHMAGLKQLASEKCTAARCRECLAVLLELSTDEDTVLAAGAAVATALPLLGSGAVCAGVYVASQEYISAMLASLRRYGALDQSAAWWKERSARMKLDAVLIYGPYSSFIFSLSVIPKIPSGSAAWEQLLVESIHMLKINQEAELSAQPQMMAMVVTQASAKVVGIAAREQSRHKALLASGVVDALLWTTAHDYSFVGSTLAEYTASASVTLVGRNEGGLTLTRETVDCVLDSVHQFWDSTSTHWRVKAAVKASVTKLVGRVQPIVDMVIADANKPFVLQHKTALDDLVLGLLVDETHPRRSQEGAAKLQETCALVLQNLALSDVGKGPLRSHSGVMAALRSVASSAGGLSDQARRYAEGALFEVDEAVRRQAKEAAAAAAHTAAAASTEDGGAAPIEHVMLSYNWDHQDVVKRLNLALKAREYAVWIDVEKMQGSTVEAMAAAVEEAAVVCYGISNAYKESVNCRLEAQYAFQQKKDMVPLMLEEGYSPNGWLGMLLGVRLWYGFFGTTLASAEAFEGKVGELCRELGDRGLMIAQAAAQSVGGSGSPSTQLDLVDPGDDRTRTIEAVLECISRLLLSVGRQERKELSRRVDALLEDVDDADVPAWLSITWMDVQVAAVAHTSETARAAEKATNLSEDEAAGAVKAVLGALEDVVASAVDKTEQLLTDIRSGELDAVVSVLDRSLGVLETLAQSLSRKERRTIDVMCEEVEGALESLQAPGVAAQLASCEESELTALCKSMRVAWDLTVQCDTEEGVSTVTAALKLLARCSDPVVQAGQMLGLEEAGARARALETLRGLPRVVLSEAVEAEVALVPAAGAIGLDEGRSNGERVSAFLAVFTLGLRNTAMAVEAVGGVLSGSMSAVFGAAFSGRLHGREGLAVVAAQYAMFDLMNSFTTQLESAAKRAASEKSLMVSLRQLASEKCTAARCREYLAVLLELSTDEDTVLAAGAAAAWMCPLVGSGAVCAGVYVASQEYIPATLASLRRCGALDQSAAWWKERSARVNLDAVRINGPYGSLTNILSVVPKIPSGSAAWEQLLGESIHMLKINQEAALSAQPQMIMWAIAVSAKVVGIAAREQSRHKALLASGVVDALLWTTAHDYSIIGVTLAEYTASASVTLIGRNEGGLTLTRETVDCVLDSVHQFWDSTSTHWRVKAAAKAPVTKLVGRVQPIVDMVIADANKPFVLQHKTALDDLVLGLLVDETHPRRSQEGAAKLQETCALVLQNLALSDVGKGPLRSHSGVMAALQSVASGAGRLSDQARRYAEGALFELDEAVRRQAKEAAAAAAHTAAAASTEDGGAAPIEHVMLSYNWDHQDVVKRLNLALKAREYAVWIDVEKMQGSTVEAMAAAVEEAAVVCYGISNAYKESTNCRLEAQYAFQQKKDMVPLMLEEGYSPNGWLGMLLGVRLWYGFFGTTLASAEAFEGKVGELCRELGDRGL